VTHRNINRAGQELIKSFEGEVLYVYDDMVVGKNGIYPEWTGWKPKGTLTIGIGHTNDAAHPLKIKQGLRITHQQALDILDVDLDECEDEVSRSIKVDLTDNQFAALVAFHFNTGRVTPGPKQATFVKALNRGEYSAVKPGLLQYVKARDQHTQELVTLRGLVRRREAEAALFTRNAVAPVVDPIIQKPQEPKGNVVPEPPAQDEPLTSSGVMRGAAGAAVPAGGLTVDKAMEVADQAQKGFDYIQAGTVFGLCCGVVILGALAYVYYSRAKAADKLPRWWPAFLGG